MRHRAGIVVLATLGLILIGWTTTASIGHWQNQLLFLPSEPQRGDVLILGTFDKNYEVCMLSPGSECGFFCSVSDGEILVRARMQNSDVWMLSMDSTLQFQTPNYREARYYNVDSCLKRDALENFRIEVTSVKNLGTDIEAIIQIGD
jgi:hypothetical protein